MYEGAATHEGKLSESISDCLTKIAALESATAAAAAGQVPKPQHQLNPMALAPASVQAYWYGKEAIAVTPAILVYYLRRDSHALSGQIAVSVRVRLPTAGMPRRADRCTQA
jgi:hypothetical protein